MLTEESYQVVNEIVGVVPVTSPCFGHGRGGLFYSADAG